MVNVKRLISNGLWIISSNSLHFLGYLLSNNHWWVLSFECSPMDLPHAVHGCTEGTQRLYCSCFFIDRERKRVRIKVSHGKTDNHLLSCSGERVSCFLSIQLNNQRKQVWKEWNGQQPGFSKSKECECFVCSDQFYYVNSPCCFAYRYCSYCRIIPWRSRGVTDSISTTINRINDFPISDNMTENITTLSLQQNWSLPATHWLVFAKIKIDCISSCLWRNKTDIDFCNYTGLVKKVTGKFLMYE